MARLLPTFLCLFLSSIGFAQIHFIDQTNLLNVNTYTSGAPIGICDMNGDFRNDIIRLHNRQYLAIEHQNADGSFSIYIHGQIGAYAAWALAAADVNNDGHSDLMVGGTTGGDIAVSDGMGGYTNVALDGPNYFVQGSSFGDVDNDGHLDLFICNDVGISNVWQNDGAGNLLSSGNALIDFELFSGGNEPNSGNYGSTWTDFDSDGDMDLYISKCRLGTTSILDGRRINQLWENDGSGNFTENAAAYGLAIGEQSWASDFQDIDNDGDLDVFIGNHTGLSNLFENQNGTYVDIMATSGLSAASGGSIIQVALKDFDNDGFVDLLTSQMLFHNNGDKTFTQITNPMGAIHSFGIGDVNQDGFLDVYADYAFGYNSPNANAPDKLWMNAANGNHFLAINLEGTTSNRSAVGASLELHGAWGIMKREVRAGESYGISHSLTQHFGLGQTTQIDSLIIKWPSGLVETFTDILADQFLMVREGACISPNVAIQTDGSTVICSGNSVNIQATTGYASYMWQDNTTTNINTASTTGNYSVSVSDGSNCQTVAALVEIVQDDVNCINPCNTNLNLFGSHSATYNAQYTIQSIGSILVGQTVDFFAGEHILLNKDFEVNLGAEFTGSIQNCTPNN